MFEKVWEDAISLNSQDEPTFEVLPPVAELPERVTWNIDPDKIGLQEKLQYYIGLDTSPLPSTEDREGYYGPRHYEYWLSGLQTAQETLKIASTYNVSLGTYVELGSASGRVIRHFAYQDKFNEYWAFDINRRHITWINRYLPRKIIGIPNSSIPHLPLPDASSNIVSAMSVFSHIETFELQWLAEIRRVLKPGGIALISAVTDHQMLNMTPEWPMYGPCTNHPRWSDTFVEELRQHGKIVLRWHADRSYSSNVIYSTDYVKDVWGRLFDIVEYRRQYPDFQDFLVLRRRP